MSERVVKANGVSIWTESFGPPDAEPVLLIMGASVQSIFWPEELIAGLVERGCFVIRYDNRDTGQSAAFDFSQDPYTLHDMALDAVGVLDAYGLDRANVCGLSMGGMIAQLLMLDHRERVKTAVLFMTSALSGSGGSAADSGDPVLLGSPDLPGPDAAWVARAVEWTALPADTREEKIHKRIESLAMMVGSPEDFDAGRARRLAELECDRALNYTAMDNHPLAVAATQPGDRRPRLATTDVPTLVIHGTQDPILPYAHGVALAETIPGAELLTLEGVGHDTSQGRMAEIAARMLALQDACRIRDSRVGER